MMLDELRQVAAEAREKAGDFEHEIRVCVAAGCLSAQSDEVKKALTKEIKARGLDKTCCVKGVGCMGPCVVGPVVDFAGTKTRFGGVTPEDVPAIVDALGGEAPEKLAPKIGEPFFDRQVRVVLKNAGRIDPEKIDEYIVNRGYEGLVKALTEKTPTDVVSDMTRSGLRGRGGGGYPVGLKWSTVSKAHGEKKYVVCNADEGDPGAFMDRSVLESDPHRVLEGMAIAAYAVGADEGYLYVRAEYPLAIKRLRKAISQAKRQGFLGNGIAGTAFNFNVEVRLGAGAFVCGEETALMASIEGGRGTPRPRPPYPANYGLWGCPTLINNVESFASVPTILREGAEWYAKIGTEKSKGTKVFALAGCVNNTGLIEVPMGMPLREILYDIGGGIPGGNELKAVQTGGPSGGCIPAEFLDMSVDYESLAEVGSIMGSGGMIVMDSSSCMVDVAKFFMEFCQSESCGKCVPCRVGTTQMHDILCKITSGTAEMSDLDMLEDLCELTRDMSLCGLGQTAPNPVVSTLRYFRDEYIAHIEGKCCPAGVCKMKTAEVTA